MAFFLKKDRNFKTKLDQLVQKLFRTKPTVSQQAEINKAKAISEKMTK